MKKSYEITVLLKGVTYMTVTLTADTDEIALLDLALLESKFERVDGYKLSLHKVETINISLK